MCSSTIIIVIWTLVWPTNRILYNNIFIIEPNFFTPSLLDGYTYISFYTFCNLKTKLSTYIASSWPITVDAFAITFFTGFIQEEASAAQLFLKVVGIHFVDANKNTNHFSTLLQSAQHARFGVQNELTPHFVVFYTDLL